MLCDAYCRALEGKTKDNDGIGTVITLVFASTLRPTQEAVRWANRLVKCQAFSQDATFPQVYIEGRDVQEVYILCDSAARDEDNETMIGFDIGRQLFACCSLFSHVVLYHSTLDALEEGFSETMDDLNFVATRRRKVFHEVSLALDDLAHVKKVETGELARLKESMERHAPSLAFTIRCDNTSVSALSQQQSVANRIRDMLLQSRLLLVNPNSSNKEYTFRLEEQVAFLYCPDPRPSNVQIKPMTAWLEEHADIRITASEASSDVVRQDENSSANSYIQRQAGLPSSTIGRGRHKLLLRAEHLEMLFGALDIIANRFQDAIAGLATLSLPSEDGLSRDGVFSYNHCRARAEAAFARYCNDLPEYYSQKVHEAKVTKALNYYDNLARGEFATFYRKSLIGMCTQERKQRRMCEALSLSGHECRKKHGHDINTLDNNADYSEKHNSNITHIQACDCGATQLTIVDPFDSVRANLYELYQSGCCKSATAAQLELPAGASYTDEIAMLRVVPMSSDYWSLIRLGTSDQYNPQIGVYHHSFAKHTNFMQPWHAWSQLSPEAGSYTPTSTILGRRSSSTSSNSLGRGRANPQDLPKAKLSAKSLNSIEAIPPNTFQDPGVHNMLQFLHSTATGRQVRPGTREAHSNSVPVDGWIGFEYECRLGHRFFSCGDGQVCSKGHQGHNKKSLEKDMPLYIVCACNYSSTYKDHAVRNMAQLQRIYFVTPSAPSLIRFAPQLLTKDIDTDSDILSTSAGSSVESVLLPPDSFLVARLPRFFSSNSTENPQQRSGYLAAHCITVAL